MNMDEYKQEFLLEAKEHIDSLNSSLLLLEKDPDNQDTINSIFRSFHTLKGNAGAMGYTKFSELAHSLESILSKVRDKKLNITKNIMDLIFEGCDLLEGGLELIEKNTPEEIRGEHLVLELNALSEKEENRENVSINEKSELTPEESSLIANLKSQGKQVFRIVAVFDAQNQLRGAKAQLLLKNLKENGENIRTIPAEQKIRECKFETEIEIILSSDKSKEELAKASNKITGIKHLFIMDVNESYAKPVETKHEENEMAKKEIADQHQTEITKQIQSVRVEMKKLDKLMNLVGELLISNIRLQDINNKQDFSSLKTTLSAIDRLILDLQDEVMEVRMVPIGEIFNRFQRMVRDLAGKEGKKVDLVIEGSEIEFDRTVLDQLGDPLVHLLRNSVDHGIETPAERMNAGKPEEGTIRLIAKREKNNAVIQVVDDGAGIDPQKVKMTAIKKGKITDKEAGSMSEEELQMLIFNAGMSTNETVTEVSGRGVGMDVVMTKTKELGGEVKLQSQLGKGTSITMQLPLTIAIISALLVKEKQDIYAIPLNVIDQTVDIERQAIKTIQGHELFLLRGKEIPLFFLGELLGKENDRENDKLTVIVANRGEHKVGIVVDTILAQQQILIKSLQDIVKGVKGCSGATILGDGNVALILDVGTLI